MAPFASTGCPLCSNADESRDWTTLSRDEDPVNQRTEAAYQAYSRYYALLALLAYWIIWRGKILKHVAFFRGILDRGTEVVDIASGEGSLTRLALFKGKKKATRVIALDLSESMLAKAKKLLKGLPVNLVRGDVMHLPFADDSVEAMTCFGGLNSFPSLQGALAELKRVLSPTGVLRGSFLLMPEARWRSDRVRKWIALGYQTTSISSSEFVDELKRSGLKLAVSQRIGDVFLFELRK